MQLSDVRQRAADVYLLAGQVGRRWPAWWLALTLAAAILSVGLVVLRAQARDLTALRAELADFTARHAAAGGTPNARPSDFSTAFPQTAPMDKLLRETFKTAARVGVTVVSAEPRDALPEAPNELAHASLALRLTGPYSGIKLLLGELLVRFPGLTVQHLRIQRPAGQAAGSQEATLTLQQWLRPRGAALATASEGK